MKKLLFTICVTALISVTSVFGASIRKDSVLMHETFESNSPTKQYWAIVNTTSCSEWSFETSNGLAALGSDGFAGYPSHAVSSGCNASMYSPKITAPAIGSNDSIIVTFYVFRQSVSTQDYVELQAVDSAGNALGQPAGVYMSNSISPATGTGWNQFNWKFKLSDITSSVPSGHFFIQFIGVSAAGADIIIDEITVHHIYQLQQTLSLTSPSQGDTLIAGYPTSINWSQTGLSKVDIFYSSNGGSTYSNLTTQNASLGTYSWSVPSVEVSNAYIKIADNSNSSTSSSVGPMVIAWPEKLITLNGGDSVVGGSNATIEWRSRSSVTKMTIDYSVDGGVDWSNIATNVASPSGSNNAYNWIVPKVVTKNAKLRLTDDNGMTVQSASVFSITHNSGIAPEADQLGFECFPNPAHDNVLVNFSNKLNQASELNIYDLKGIRVAQTMLSTGANQASVDLKAITPGVYFVEVKNNQFVAKQKLVIY